MDAFASPSIRGATPGPVRYRIVEAVLTTLGIALSLFSVLGRADPRLDASWQVMLIHAHSEGLQFGRDIIFTWGPWGFLFSLTNLGGVAATPILVWQVGGHLLVSVALVVLTWRLVLWRRIAFVASLLAFHWLFLDTVYFVLIALIAIAGLMRPMASLFPLVAWTLVLGFLAQVKFTYFAISAAAVLSAMACWAGRGSWKRSWTLAVAYVCAVVASWVSAGQGLVNLYPYFRRSLEIALGYADAMGFDESRSLLLWGTALALICTLFVWRIWRTVPDRAFAWAASAYLAFSFVVAWKESFTRADLVPLGGHVFGFFTYVLILGPALPGVLFPGKRWHWFDCTIGFCLIAIASFDADYYRLGPRVAWQLLHGQMEALEGLQTLPDDWQRSFDEASADASLPEMKSAVGNGTVDVYNYGTAIAFLNGMRLSARPVFQSYSAYTPSLEEYNLRHYQSDRAPDFLIWADEGVDGRYPGQDDAMLIAALPGHYEAKFKEGGYWLFRKVSPVSLARPELRLVLHRSVRLGEEIELPSPVDHSIWIRADPAANKLGGLRALLYKPALINIATTDDRGRQRSWRLLPRVARSGFILVPTLEDGTDLELLMGGEARSRLKSFHFESPDGQGAFWSSVDVSLFQMPTLPLGHKDSE
jgi:hypothetical protein